MFDEKLYLGLEADLLQDQVGRALNNLHGGLRNDFCPKKNEANFH